MRKLVFVDGTNYLTELAKALTLNFRPDRPPKAILNLASTIVHLVHKYPRNDYPYRIYWFGSYTGADSVREELCDALRENRIEATLFQRRENREKGVDIGVTKEMLVHAFQRNADEVTLVAGDEDYVGLVNEVKRYGVVVNGAFFENAALSPHLRRSFDNFTDVLRLANSPDMSETVQRCKQQFPLAPIPPQEICPTCSRPMKRGAQPVVSPVQS